MPTSINGFGTSICAARGLVFWHKMDLLSPDCDAVESLVLLFIPVAPLKAVHAFNRSGGGLSETYQAIPLRMEGGLFLTALLRRLVLALLLLSLPLAFGSCAAFFQKASTPVLVILPLLAVLFFAGGALGYWGLKVWDKRDADIRYLLGRHELGSSDPATWAPQLLPVIGRPQNLFGTRTYAAAVQPLLERGEYSQAMWAARLAVALENQREGEALTDKLLRDRNVQRAVEAVRREPARWAEVMGGDAGKTMKPAPTRVPPPTATPVVGPPTVAGPPAVIPLTGVRARPVEPAAVPSPPTAPFAFAADDRGPRRSSQRSAGRQSNSPLILILCLAVGLPAVVIGGLILVIALAVTLASRDGDHLPDPQPPDRPRAQAKIVDANAVIPRGVAHPVAPPDVAGKKTVDLIPLIDPARDTINGRWVIAKNVLRCDEGAFVPRIEIPYQPPQEYDFIVEFSQPDLRNGISLIMPNPNGGSFFWALGFGEGSEFCFHSEPDLGGKVPKLIEPKLVYTTTVQVRRDSVRALVNGKELVSVKTDYHDLTCDDWRKLRNTRFLGVACDDPTVFHFVRVVEITGAGKKAR